MEEDRTALGDRVRDARLDRGWSKEEAARVAGISAITWKRIEDGLSVQDPKRYAALRALDLMKESAAQQAPREDAAIAALREELAHLREEVEHLKGQTG